MPPATALARCLALAHALKVISIAATSSVDEGQAGTVTEGPPGEGCFARSHEARWITAARTNTSGDTNIICDIVRWQIINTPYPVVVSSAAVVVSSAAVVVSSAAVVVSSATAVVSAAAAAVVSAAAVVVSAACDVVVLQGKSIHIIDSFLGASGPLFVTVKKPLE